MIRIQINDCHPEALFWPKDLPQFASLECLLQGFRSEMLVFDFCLALLLAKESGKGVPD